jgi:hypothetical protein
LAARSSSSLLGQLLDLLVLLQAHLIERLDGDQGDAVGVYCADRRVALPQPEGRVEILGHRPDMANRRALPLVVPFGDRDETELVQDRSAIEGSEVLFDVAVAGAREGPAAGWQIAASGEIGTGAEAEAAGLARTANSLAAVESKSALSSVESAKRKTPS